MRDRRILSLVAVAVVFGSVTALAGGVKVIANPSVQADSITVADLRNIFLEDKRSLNGSRVEPVLAKGGAPHETFVREYLGTSANRLRTYYRTLIFTGTGAMPRFLESDADIFNYVAKTKGAIGYVDGDFPTEGVKVISVLGAGVSSERRLITRLEPEYPVSLRSLQIGGTVRLMVTISPNGSVEEVQVLGGNPILAESAVKAVKQWVYAAGRSEKVEVSLSFDPRR